MLLSLGHPTLKTQQCCCQQNDQGSRKLRQLRRMHLVRWINQGYVRACLSDNAPSNSLGTTRDTVTSGHQELVELRKRDKNTNKLLIMIIVQQMRLYATASTMITLLQLLGPTCLVWAP